MISPLATPDRLPSTAAIPTTRTRKTGARSWIGNDVLVSRYAAAATTNATTGPRLVRQARSSRYRTSVSDRLLTADADRELPSADEGPGIGASSRSFPVTTDRLSRDAVISTRNLLQLSVPLFVWKGRKTENRPQRQETYSVARIRCEIIE